MALVHRLARAADYPAFARLFPELGTGDPLPEHERWTAEICPRTWLFEQEDVAVGYVLIDRLDGVGYVRHVVVDPAHRGRGLGAAMMRVVGDDLRAHGCTRWCLNVKPDNLPAVALYRRLGMREAYRSVALRFRWSDVDRLGPPARPLGACPIDPAEDAAIEQAFALPRGQLADARALRARWALVRLVDPHDPAALGLGFAAFNPDFPGAFPFRVADPADAAALLAGLRPHARPDLPDMGIVAEDDPGLVARMREIGATVKMEFAHYAGPLAPG